MSGWIHRLAVVGIAPDPESGGAIFHVVQLRADSSDAPRDPTCGAPRKSCGWRSEGGIACRGAPDAMSAKRRLRSTWFSPIRQRPRRSTDREALKLTLGHWGTKMEDLRPHDRHGRPLNDDEIRVLVRKGLADRTLPRELQVIANLGRDFVAEVSVPRNGLW